MSTPETLAGQFLISIDAPRGADGWHCHRLDDLYLTASPATAVIPAFDGNGHKIGMLIGAPIDLEKLEVLGNEYHIDASLERSDDLNDFVERYVYNLAGSFLFVLSAMGKRRVYLDANGSLSLVYDPQSGIAGATAAAMLTQLHYRQRFRASLYKELDVDHAGWFTAGLTAHTGIQRLLCNHYLDLDSWTAYRHWPIAPINVSSDPASTFAKICDRITRSIQTYARAGQTSVALTAGNDSRLLLACCRHMRQDVSFVTVDAPGAEVDVACAARLAREFGLDHEVLPYKEASAAQADLWRLRTGHCLGGTNVWMHPSVQPLEGRCFVGGLGGEIGRGFLWLSAQHDTPLSANGLVARLKLPQNAEVVRAVETWLEPVSHYDTLFKLDLAYMELRMSCWGFADSYVKPLQNEVHPMVSRANYVDMLSIPADLRRNKDIFLDAIRHLWPDVLRAPINRFGDRRDVVAPVSAALRNPRKASKKVLQLIGAIRW
jgi:hypothetical protein